MPDATAHIDVLPIPDRMDRGRPRLCVQLTPTTASCLGGSAALADWPEAMVARASEMRVWRAQLVDGVPTGLYEVGVFPGDIAGLAALTSTTPGKTVGECALEKWREIFLVPGFDVLREAIATPGVPTIGECVRDGSALGIAAAQTALLDRMLDDSLMRSILGEQESAEPDIAALARTFDLQQGAPLARTATRLASLRWLDLKLPHAALEKEFVGTCAARSPAPLMGGGALAAARGAMEELAAILQADQAPDPTQPPPGDRIPTPAEIAMRKLNTLLAFPTLAKYFGLCADILLPADAFGFGEMVGALAVELKVPGATFGGTPDPRKLNWTAFACRIPKGRTARHFGVWDGEGARAADEPLGAFDKGLYLDGLVNLRHKIGTAPTFHLGSGEVINTLLRLNEANPSNAQIGSAVDADKKALAVNRRTKGIILYREPAREQVALESRRETARLACGADVLTINYAEEMSQGIRLDVQLLCEPGLRDEQRWRPLMARNVTIDPSDVDANFLKDPRVVEVRYRDEGVAAAPVAEIPSGDRQLFVASQEMAVWSGGGLGLSVSNDLVQLDPANDVAISVTFGMRAGEASGRYLPPPFRLGRRYVLRARIALPLGCGATFDDLQADPGGERHTLPEALQGFAYKRYEQIGAPVLAFRWDHSLVTTKGLSATAGPQKRNGRTIEQMVVRAGEAAFATDTRFILPPRVSIDEAEQQGQFDAPAYVKVKVPPGAFEGNAPIVLYGPDGQLPDARAGTISWFDSTNDTFHADRPSTLTSKELESAQSRGSVLVMDRAALARQQRLYGALELPQPRYYPDRYARQMIVALSSVPHFSSPQITTGGPRIAQFWKPAQTPRDATPIMLELARGAEDPGKPAGIQIGSTSMQLPDGATVAVPKVTVSLQPGEVMDLELFANPAAKEFRANHHGAALIKDPGDYRPSSAWSTARKELCHVRTVRLVHAVKRPVRPPAFGIAAGKIDLRAVTRTVRPEGTPGDIPQWSDIANSGKPIVSEEGGGTTFFIGAATIHGRSTCELRCEARWKDYGIDSIKRDPATGRWVADTPVQYDQLFHIKGIASAKASLPVNLLRDDGELRALSHAFRDGRARCLQVRLVATSRFTDYFPPDPDADDRVDTIGAFERASNDFNPAQAIWTDCIFRPPPPVVDRILPIFDWTRGKDGNRLTFARQSRLRLFLDRRWFASGEGEQLALVFDQAKRKLCDYEDDKLIPYAQYLTRWGRDPIRLTRHVELVRPGDIVGNEIGELFLHAETGTDTGKRPAPHPVTIIAFTPELDPVLGLYCDIRLANPQGALFSYMPFIQLGLARYQEHAVEALKLSHPVQCMVQILPDRAGYVQISGPTSVKVVVSGPAFGSMEDEYHRMRLNVRLMERIPLPGGGEGSWRPARGGDNRDVVMLDQRPNGAIDDELWSIELTLPASHMGTHYGLLIEEYEMLPADPVEQVENAPRGADPLEGTQLFQRGPLFQTTVDLRQPNDPYEGA